MLKKVKLHYATGNPKSKTLKINLPIDWTRSLGWRRGMYVTLKLEGNTIKVMKNAKEEV